MRAYSRLAKSNTCQVTLKKEYGERYARHLSAYALAAETAVNNVCEQVGKIKRMQLAMMQPAQTKANQTRPKNNTAARENA